jgi:hypothetical protein
MCSRLYPPLRPVFVGLRWTVAVQRYPGCDNDTEGGPTVFCAPTHVWGQPLAVLLLQFLRATALIPR